MTHHTDPRQIEEDIARERASLASTIDALQDRASVDHMAREALGMIKTNAAAYTRSIDEAVRANPVAVALTGVGLAWLVFGSKKSSTDRDDMPDRWGKTAPNAHPHYPYDTDVDKGWSQEADRLRARASASLRRVEADAKSYYARLRDGAADTYEDARDYASERAAILADFANDLARSFSSGLDQVSEQSRERIIAARERAYSARLKAERTAKKTSSETVRFIEDHPLVAGAIAAALGAALATALPRTRIEDRTFGAESDRLMDEANRLYRSERARALRIAEGVGDELKDAAIDTMDTVSDKAEEAVTRAKDRVVTEAKKPQSAKRKTAAPQTKKAS